MPSNRSKSNLALNEINTYFRNNESFEKKQAEEIKKLRSENHELTEELKNT